MDRHGLDGLNAYRAFDVAEGGELEFADLMQSVGVLPVVLNDVEVVGDGEEATEGGGFAVPERGGDDAWVAVVC